MLWVLAFHIIFIVTFFAGVFYLPRLFVYHADCRDEVSNARFKIMERRLFYGIIIPSAVLMSITGFWLLLSYGWAQNHQYYWLHLKLILVGILFIYLYLCWHYLRAFRDDRNIHRALFYRWFNEVPSVLLIAIVVLAIVRPF